MAAVTVNSRNDSVQGSKRVVDGNVDIAADTDTWATGLAVIHSVSAISQTNNAIGCTVSGGTITFQTAGAETGVLVRAEGL